MRNISSSMRYCRAFRHAAVGSLAIFILTMTGCGQFYRTPSKARFALLDGIDKGEIVYPQRESPDQDPHTPKVSLNKSDIQSVKGGLNIFFREAGGSLEFTPEAAGLPPEWTGYQELRMKVENPGSKNLKILISIKGSRGILNDTLALPSGEKTTHQVDLTDLPLTAGVQPPYQPKYIELTALMAPAGLILHSAKLTGSVLQNTRQVVDQFGQRKSRTWPGKITSEAQLKSGRETEWAQLNGKLRHDWDTYGGWIDGPQLEATGFFRVTRHEGSYWFLTPEGRLMWSFGVTGIRPNAPNVGVTQIAGREYLYEKVPPKTCNDVACWTSEEDASFYAWNILRKYGSLEAWRETAFMRLGSWGYNTIGNWSETGLLLKAQTPFTISLNTNIPDSENISGVADVFNPAWEIYLDSVFSQTEQWRENPFLLGYFVDNEAGWGNLELLRNMPPLSWTRKLWLEFIQDKYPTLRELNFKWDVAFKEWTDVRDLMTQLENDYFIADYIEFETLFAEKYFGTIASTLKKHDPNHLYLGCRFTRALKPAHICAIAGKYSDVVTVNVYARTPSDEIMGEWHRLTGKPILIGEHHINLASERQVPALWGAETADERRIYYQNYVETWAKLPYSLGCHWYQFSDQEITGRSSNGENQPVGLVDITDQPHNELIETAKELSGKIYHWHNASRQAFSVR